ncbi:MAG: hypothetical protein M3259_04505 [Actinomycetota bacterium]|nr:hypothetical protein [Actinomycetota bacterium]
MRDPHPRRDQSADEPARRQGKRVHGKANKAYGNHRIPAWPKGKKAVQAHRNEKAAAGYLLSVLP